MVLIPSNGWSCAHMASRNGNAACLGLLAEACGKELFEQAATNDGFTCSMGECC